VAAVVTTRQRLMMSLVFMRSRPRRQRRRWPAAGRGVACIHATVATCLRPTARTRSQPRPTNGLPGGVLAGRRAAPASQPPQGCRCAGAAACVTSVATPEVAQAQAAAVEASTSWGHRGRKNRPGQRVCWTTGM
jgi:hypothetical protein